MRIEIDVCKKREELFVELCNLLNKKEALQLIAKVDALIAQAERDALELQHM